MLLILTTVMTTVAANLLQIASAPIREGVQSSGTPNAVPVARKALLNVSELPERHLGAPAEVHADGTLDRPYCTWAQNCDWESNTPCSHYYTVVRTHHDHP